MRQRLAPMLFDDTDKQAAEALRPMPRRCAQVWWRRRSAHPPPSPSRRRVSLRTDCRSTASALCSPISRRWRATPLPPRSRPTIRSPSSPGQRRSSRKRSISSVSDVASSTRLRRKIVTIPQELTRSPSRKLGLARVRLEITFRACPRRQRRALRSQPPPCSGAFAGGATTRECSISPPWPPGRMQTGRYANCRCGAPSATQARSMSWSGEGDGSDKRLAANDCAPSARWGNCLPRGR